MKSLSLKVHILLMALFSLLLIGLLINVQAFDTSEPNHMHRLLGHVIRLDAESEQSMLRIYNRSMFDFDQLVDEIRHMRSFHAQLAGALSSKGTFTESLSALEQSVYIQREAVDEFKSAFSILSSSLRYLPTLCASISARHPDLKPQLLHLKNDVFEWRFYPENAAILDRIRRQSDQAGGLGLDMLQQHIRVILSYGPMVLEAIEKAATCGVLENATVLFDAYDQDYANKVEENRNNQLLLALLGLLLLVYLLTLLVFRQRDAMRLAESEKRFRLLFDLIPDGVGVHKDGKWIYCNPAAVFMFGAASANDLIGTPVLERVHPDFHQEVVRRIREEAAQGKGSPLMQQRNLRLDGSEFYGEVQGIPFAEDGQTVMMAVIRDVTARVEAETRMRQLAIAMENTAEAIMISDFEACIQYVNPAFERMTGYALTAVEGQFERIILCSDAHDDAFYQAICDTVKSGRIWRGEVIIRNKNSQLITTMRSVSPVTDDQGKVVNYITVMRDVTREKEIQAKMEHMQRLESLGVLAGGIAHDFNNILTAVMGNAALAERSLDDRSPAKELLSRIEASTQRAADLCKQMLAYSGKGKFIVKSINLSELVKEMTRLMDVSIAKSVVIKYRLADHLPTVKADAAQLQQIILNLITNANEAIDDKSGVISFATGVMYVDAAYLEQTVCGETLPDGRYVYVEVSDTGCGMDADTMQKIFDPFFTTKFTGRGLGMSAVLGIVRGHHGALRVYSEVGTGTTFKILLPVAADASVEPVDQATTLDDWQASGTILVVDDEETIREVAAMMLEEMGFSTLTAENGLEALEIFSMHQRKIRGVLLDMTMPKMGGEECFRELRRIDPEVRVILSSGYNEQDATDSFVGKGLASFIQKPYTPEALRKTIMDALDGDAA